ncbi:MAG: hypothetical protein FJX25_11880 [Alphaproteobacteria bacterium]|nr:hypothetical protein [Alphaproteobacteria bacterium]
MSGQGHGVAGGQGGTSRPLVVSDAAVRFCMMVKVLFGLPLRQVEPWKRHWFECPWRGGMRAGILKMVRADWPVPDVSTPQAAGRRPSLFRYPTAAHRDR